MIYPIISAFSFVFFRQCKKSVEFPLTGTVDPVYTVHDSTPEREELALVFNLSFHHPSIRDPLYGNREAL